MLHPIEWINSKIDAFLALPQRWNTLYESARSVFESEALSRFNGPLATRFVQSQREIDALILMRDIDRMRLEHRAVLDKLEFSGPLSGPIVVAIVVVSAAAVVITIASLFRRSTAAEEAVAYLISTGAPPAEILQAVKATAEEKATGIDKVVGDIASIVKLGILAGVAFMVAPMFRKGR